MIESLIKFSFPFSSDQLQWSVFLNSCSLIKACRSLIEIVLSLSLQTDENDLFSLILIIVKKRQQIVFIFIR